MSLKDNLEMVKDELNSEEKFFEKAVITEKFVKKYKKPLIGVVITIVLIVAGNLAYESSEQSRIKSANETLAQLEKNPNNKIALKRLQSLSPTLHDAWIYSQAIATQNVADLEKLKDTKALIINDTSHYELAQDKSDLNKLESYSEKQNAIYKDLAVIMSAIILIQDGKINEAHNKLSMVIENSPMSQVATALMHYGVK